MQKYSKITADKENCPANSIPTFYELKVYKDHDLSDTARLVVQKFAIDDHIMLVKLHDCGSSSSKNSSGSRSEELTRRLKRIFGCGGGDQKTMPNITPKNVSLQIASCL